MKLADTYLLEMSEVKGYETKACTLGTVSNVKFAKKYRPSTVAGYHITLYNDELAGAFPELVRVSAIFPEHSTQSGGYAVFIGNNESSTVDILLNFDNKKGFTGCSIVENEGMKSLEKIQSKAIKTVAKDLLAMAKERVVFEGSWPKSPYLSVETKRTAKGKFSGDIEVPNDNRGFARIGALLADNSYAVRVSAIED